MLTNVLLILGAAQLAIAQWNIFTVPHVDGYDDAPALRAALPDFASNSTIWFKEGITYNIFTPIKFPVLNNVKILVEGNLTYPTNISTVQAIFGNMSSTGVWFTFTGGYNVTLQGSEKPDWGWIDDQVPDRPRSFKFTNIRNGVSSRIKPTSWYMGNCIPCNKKVTVGPYDKAQSAMGVPLGFL